MLAKLKFVVEKHAECYVAYPLGMRGGVVGEGASGSEALADARSAAQQHVDVFGPDVLEEDLVLDAVTEDGAISL